MTLVDANLLLHAVNVSSPQHGAAKAWLDDALSGDERVGLPWLSLLAFVRIASHPAIFPSPLTSEQAVAVVRAWCARPSVVHPEPSSGFVDTFARVLGAAQAHGGLVNDAYLVALAIEYGARVVTFDRDFTRFDGVETVRPA